MERRLANAAGATSINLPMLFRALIVWVVIAMVETVHGILRIRLLNRRVGDHRARQIAVATGSGIVVSIAWFTMPWIAPLSLGDSLAVGTLWLVTMLAFEISLGRFVFHVPWARIGSDFNLRRGGLLAFGMLVLFLAPWLISQVRGIF